MKVFKYLIFFLFILLLSCTQTNVEPEQHFPITGFENLKFEYYYEDYDEDKEPTYLLNLEVKEDLHVEGKTYNSFYSLDNDPPPPFMSPRDDNKLKFNFYPIRKENGDYYEYRFGREVLILKDNIQVGDKWENTFNVNGVERSNIFEVIDKHDVFTIGGQSYKNVYQIKESYADHSGLSKYASFHYYNKTYGIVRREIDITQTGTYGAITFNRLAEL